MSSSDHRHHKIVTSDSSGREYIKFGLVLLAIFLVSGLLVQSADGDFEYWMRMFMGVFFLVFAGFKLAGYKMFVLMFAGYDLIAKKVKAYSYSYPFIELAMAYMYLFNQFGSLRDSFVLITMTVSAIGVAQEIYHRRSGVYCACLGNIIKLPLSTVSLVENVTMGLMAGLMLAL